MPYNLANSRSSALEENERIIIIHSTTSVFRIVRSVCRSASIEFSVIFLDKHGRGKTAW